MSTSQVSLAIIALLTIIVLGFWGCPQYKVYSQRKEGEAMLAHAQSSRENVIYVPTEANLPVMEANRLMQKKYETDALK